jgi:PPOX class probable F420-dependent enzyme
MTSPAPVPIPDHVREVLLSDGLAHLVTLNPDGSPQVSIVWVGIEDEEIVLGSLGARRKLSNIERDPRVAVSIETQRTNAMGLREYLVVHGEARVTEGGAPELLQRLAETYVGPGVRFPPMDDPPAGFVVRIRPDRYAGVGPWAS